MKYIILFLVMAFYSCGMNKFDKEAKTILIDEYFREEIALSEIFRDFDIIKLETSEKSMLSNIWKIEKDSDRVFCYDESLSKVFIFDDKGHFVASTANTGKGPEEVLGCADFSIDRNRNILEILDNMSKKILSYNYNGQLIKAKQGVPRSGFEIMNSQVYIGYSYNQFVEIEPKVISFNNIGNQLYKFDHISTRSLQRNTYSNLEKSSLGDIFLIPVYELNLFQFADPFNCSKIAEFTFSNQIPTQKYAWDDDFQIKEAIKNDGAPYLIKDLHIVKQTVYFKYLYGSESGHFFWNMKNNHQVFSGNSGIVNDLTPNIPFSIQGISENGLLCVISASSLKMLLENKGQSSELSKIVAKKNFSQTNLSDQDNPIIINYIYNAKY